MAERFRTAINPDSELHNRIVAVCSRCTNMTDITYTDVDSEVFDILNKCFLTSFRNGYVKANDVVLPVYFKKFGQRIQDMEIRDDDVWVCSFPKTGLNLKYKNYYRSIVFNRVKQLLIKG